MPGREEGKETYPLPLRESDDDDDRSSCWEQYVLLAPA
jgi:hypothetical protein